MVLEEMLSRWSFSRLDTSQKINERGTITSIKSRHFRMRKYCQLQENCPRPVENQILEEETSLVRFG